MKFRVERDALADAVAWTARSLPARPAVPVLGGVLLEVTDNTLTVSGFDYEVSTQVEVEVHAAVAGRALVSGRLLAEISRALPPHPVDLAVDGPKVTISCGSARFTLPLMPVEDYPTLPTMPTTAGVVDSATFATAVSQVAVAAGRDDTLPMLTGVRLEIEGDELRLAATDRYRLAVRELPWKPEQNELSAQVLIPARTLSESAKTLTTGSEITLALAGGGAGEGMIGFAGPARRTTTRLLDAEFPKYRSLFPTEWSATARHPGAGAAGGGQAGRARRRPRHARPAGFFRGRALADRRRRRRGPGRGAGRGAVLRRAADHRVQPHLPAGRADRGARRDGADVLHDVEQAVGDHRGGRRRHGRLPLPDHAGATARLGQLGGHGAAGGGKD